MQSRIVPLLLIYIILLTLLFSGCSTEPVAEEKPKPVRTLVVSEETYPLNLEYFGVVDSAQIKRYSFKSPGRVARIYVGKGDPISEGQLLAELERTDLNFAVKAAEQTFKKAEAAYNDAVAMFDKVNTLYQEGFSSKRELDLAKLDRDVKEASLEQARVDLEHKQNMVAEASLYSDMDGYVMEIPLKEGEITDAGYPVIAARSSRQLIKIGLTQDDLNKVDIGTPVIILNNDREFQGEIARIDQYPDKESRTYNTEIIFANEDESQDFYLGSTCRVHLQAGEKQGIWIPLTAIQNDGQDYVYTVREDRALRKYITIENYRGIRVLVNGLSPGDELVTEGLQKLTDGCPIIREGI